jgi:hypothetical protein
MTMNTTATLPAPSNIAQLPSPQMGGDIFATPAAFEHAQRVVKAFCASVLIPQHLRGNNGADALLALAIARRMGEDPVMVFQNIYIVHGRAGWSASYMIARANRSGVFKGPIRWKTEGAGDAMKVTAFATLAETGETVESVVGMTMAKAEGWAKNTKYQTMGEHMLRYRSATFLIRLYCPEVMLGMQTHEELVDLTAAGQMRDITPTGDTNTALRAVAAIDDVPAEGGDAEIIESADNPVADASGADAASQPAPAPEAPTLDFGAPAAADGFDLELTSQAILRQIEVFKAPRGIDNYLATDKAEEMARILAEAPEMHAFIVGKATARKKALAPAR